VARILGATGGEDLTISDDGSQSRNESVPQRAMADPGAGHRRTADPEDNYSMRRPEMLRAMTRRWISEVPSKIV